MPLDPVTAIKALGGVLSIFGGKKAPSTKAQARDNILGAVEGGRIAGLHPLAAIGASNSGYSTPATGSAIGDGLTTVADAIQGGRDRKAAISGKPAELLDAQIAEARSRTVLNQANAQRTLVGPNAPFDPFEMRNENALINVLLENGEIIKMPNPDLYEVGPAELATGRAIIEGARQYQKPEKPLTQAEYKALQRQALDQATRSSKTRTTRRNPWEH